MMPGRSGISEQTNGTGSPKAGEPVFLVIGKLRRTHGVRGEMLMDIETDFPERIKNGQTVFVGDEKRPHTIASLRLIDRHMLVAFEGYADCDAAAVFRNQLVYVLAQNLPGLPRGDFYQHEVLGMVVKDEAGNVLGTVAEILVTGANDVYVIKAESGQELLLPAIKSVILGIDAETRTITARPQEWN